MDLRAYCFSCAAEAVSAGLSFGYYVPSYRTSEAGGFHALGIKGVVPLAAVKDDVPRRIRVLTGRCYSVEMDKHKILADAKAELERYVWGTFVDGKASVANSGTGVVVSGCEACRKRFGTNSQYLRHLAEDVLPEILENTFKQS